MKIVDVNIFEGKNIYSHKKCIRMELDLEGYCETPSNKIEGFNTRLVKLLPELKKHRCGIDEDRGFLKRLNEGTYLAHITEHSIIALQNMIGIDVAYGKAREIEGDRYYIIYQYEYKNTALETGRLAVDIVNCLIKGNDFNLKPRLVELKNIMSGEQLGPSTISICEEAKKRGIPVLRVGDKSMFQLGYGKYGKMIEATICGDTSGLAIDIACDKLLTKETLVNQCIPVANGERVLSPVDLITKCEDIGYPVVLKPRFGNQGKGVFVNIQNGKQAVEAYNILAKNYEDIMIEKHIKGRDFRVCVVDGKVIAAAERIPPYVVGDGVNTVRKLISDINKDQRRGNGHEKPLTKIKMDESLCAYISKKGYDLSSILPKNEKLILRENANLSTGGIAVDCTDQICKENIEICERTAKAIGLNICGIDICCNDINIPLTKEGAIIEVNAAPGIRMHHYPCRGESKNVAAAIVDMMFKDDKTNIPVVSVTGTNGKTTTTRLIAHTLSLLGHKVGMTTTGGIYINNKCIYKGDTTGYNSAMTLLMNKEIDAAVLETARGGIIKKGLAYDLADVGIITNITEDHLGLDGVNTLEDLAKVKALVGEAVKSNGFVVMNADDEISKTIVERMKTSIIFFSKDKNNKLMRKNINNGGYGVYSDNGCIYLESNEAVTPIVKTNNIKITLNGKLKYNIENSMAACAALVGLGVEYSIIRKGLSSFYCNEEQNPGRFNMYNVNGRTVILDYGHNIQGYKAVLEGAKNIRHKKFIGIIGVPGDRLDSNVIQVGEIAGKYFDYIYIKEDEDKRGRKTGEIAKLLEKGVLASNFDKNNYEIILDEVEALNRAIEVSKPGDVVIIFFEKFEPLVKVVKEKVEVENEILPEAVPVL
ncbi:cyanophycin synthetase [Clostridium sp. YIM B02515]|uniref:Cyanophycin synthetase n=1 Tax=Clostridium rhizosphaerae TaxID=2803861 RepID=A0ABS1T978_9CLOT|nr:cyanophycin synthetase [Clostridium rhizosphaerae]MBL4935816.1 cyanophycin synthetase [Clostridium rhizosphaerae]